MTGGVTAAFTSLRAQASALLLIMSAFLGGGFVAAYVVEHGMDGLMEDTARARLQVRSAQDVLSALQDAETGQRGYLLTGQADDLAPFERARQDMEPLLSNLIKQTAPDHGRSALAARLLVVTREKMAELQATVASKQRGDDAAALAVVLSDIGRQHMVEARGVASQIIDIAERERTTRAEQLRQRQAVVTMLLLGALVGGVVLLGAAVMVLLWITSRLRAARRSGELQAAKLEAAIEQVPDGVAVFDSAERLTLLNARFAATLRLEAPARGTVLPAIASEAALDPPALAGGRPAHSVTLEARQGPRTLQVWRSPMPDGGQIVAVVDLTLRVAAEEAVRRAQRMDVLGQMTGGVAHDFNNLLQVISANLELARMRLVGGQSGEPVLQRLDAASAGVARGASLVRHLLAFARRQPLAPEPLDAQHLLLGLEDLLQRTLGAAATLEISVEPGLWPMRADPAQFESALLNLAINARDAMTAADGDARGTLSVSAANVELTEVREAEITAGAYVVFAVTDTGAGMTAAEAARALEPFYSTKPEGKGTGLGLPMVLGFAKQSGGHLQLESEPGQGTTVRLYIPRSAEPAAAPHNTGAAAEPMRPHAAEGELVLLAEDDLEVRAAAQEALAALGYRTVEADSGQAALALLDGGARPDLLLTDVVMPGPVTARQLAGRAEALIPGIAVVFMSGYTQDEVGNAGHLPPGTTLLTKPWRADDLARTLRTALADARRPGRARAAQDDTGARPNAPARSLGG